MKHPSVRWVVVLVAVLLWMLAVLPAYYVVHKPFLEWQALRLSLDSTASTVISTVLSRAADVLVMALSLVVAAAWGSRIQRWIGVHFDSQFERWVMGATLGLGVLASVVFFIGVFGGLYRWLAYTVLAVLGLAAASEIKALSHWLTAVRHVRPTGIPWIGLYVSLIGLFSLGMALLPPTSWDALVYHLQGPRLYVEAHRLVGVTENLYLNWPAQVEMLFTWGMLLKGDILAKLFHWIFWLLTALMTYSLARRTIGKRAAGYAVVLWASIPFAAELAGIAYIDLGLTAFVLAAFSCFLYWSDSENNRWLVLSALFVGLAMATKYTAITWLALFVPLLGYHAWRHQHRSLSWMVTQATSFVLIASIPLLPWLIKNWMVTGNPVYPFVFGGTDWNATRQALIAGSGGGYSQNPLDYLLLPWLTTVLGTSGTASFDATTGPLLLLLVPLVFLIRQRPRPVTYGLALAVGQLVCFAATIHQYVYLAETRLLLPIFPVLCLVAGFALDRLDAWDRRELRLSRLVGGIVLVVLAVNLATETSKLLSVHPMAPLLGLESPDAYLDRRLGVYQDVMRSLNDRLPADSRILFLFEPRGYYSQHAVLADATLDNLPQLRLRYDDADTAIAGLQESGFTHVLIYRSGLSFLLAPPPRPPTLESLLRSPLQEESTYPLSQDDLHFGEALLARCQQVEHLGEFYDVYQFP